MKRSESRARRFACSLAMGLLLATGTLWAGQDELLSKKDLKTLIANAKTPQDHLRLAAHFAAKADQLEADANDHFELSKSINRRDRGYNHCASLAETLHKAAAEARNLSVDHSEMAKQTQK